MFKKTIETLILSALMLLYMRFFTYINLDLTFIGRITNMTTLVMLVICIPYIVLNPHRPEKSYKYILLITFWPLLTAVSCYLGNGQSIMESFRVTLPHWTILIYFLCLKYEISTKVIIRVIILFALVRTGLTIIQQFTYPDVWFSMRSGVWDDSLSTYQEELRSGVYRFLISDAYYLPLFMGFYGLSKLFQKFRIKYLLLFFIAAVGIYLDQTRQVLVSFAASLIIVPLFSRTTRRGKIFLVSAILLFVIALPYDTFFSELDLKTKEDFNDDNIRLLSYAYYWENLGDWLTTVFGNGIAGLSEYGKSISNVQGLGLWRVDIGVVGAIHMMGFGCVFIFIFYLFAVIVRYWNNLDLSLKMFFVSAIIQLPLIFPIYNTTLPAAEFFMGLVFYLVDKSLQNQRYKLKSV